MFDNIENLKLISSSIGTARKSENIKCRKMHCFVFRLSGQKLFDFGEKAIVMNPGEVIFLPQGSSYRHSNITEECRYMSISFHADISNPKPAIWSFENFTEADYICNHFADLWNLGTQSERHKCYSLFYSLLSYISGIDALKYSDRRKFEVIEPAILYLKTHIFDIELKTDYLHTLCGISDTYFRKIFTAKYNSTPQSYIINKRISYAKSLIDSGGFENISDIAAAVGYSDPLYFSKAFKKKYGMPPSKANKEI